MPRRISTGSTTTAPSPIKVQKVLFLLFNAYSETLSVSNKLRPVDLAAGDHGKIAFYAALDCPASVPVVPILITKVRVYVLKPLINSLHSPFDVRQPRLLVAEPVQRKTKVQPRDIVTSVLRKRFFQSLARLRIVTRQILGPA